jgi:hypothetical protein
MHPGRLDRPCPGGTVAGGNGGHHIPINTGSAVWKPEWITALQV